MKTQHKNKFFGFFFIAFLWAMALVICQPAQAETEMAITVDDLPISGPLPPNVTRMDVIKQILAIFKKHHLEGVYGFINGGTFKKDSDGLPVLQTWVSDGELLGNHTYTHANLNKISAQQYMTEIKRNDVMLAQLMGDKNYKYFRYPFLAEGNTPQKRDAIRQYLASQGYQIAPVTVDFADWEYFAPYVRCLKRNNQQAIAWLDQSSREQSLSALHRAQAMSQAIYHRDMKQILLVHASIFDAHMLDGLLTAYEKQGVKFVPLQVALNDDAYKTNISFADTKGFTFYNQALRAKGMKMPKSVSKLYISFPEDKLKNICR